MLRSKCRHNILLDKLLSCLLECFLLLSCIKPLWWLDILLHPLVLYWLLFDCVISCFSAFTHHYVDIPTILSGLCRDPLYVLIVLILFFLNLPQKCWEFLCIMVCCATIDACRRWKWKFPCIITLLLEVMVHY
jgi:hypothetical protein